MQKLIAVPMVRYKNLVDKENSKSGLKQAVAATMKLQENHDLLRRQRHYDLIDEEMPKNSNKIIPMTAVTALPPPPIHKIREYKKRKQMLTDAELDAFFGTKTRKNKKNTMPKPVIKKQTKPKPTSSASVKIQKSKFNLFDRAAFHKKSKKVTIRYHDGRIVLFEKVVEKLTLLEKFSYSFNDGGEEISTLTVPDVIKMNHLKRMILIKWNNLPEKFDLELFSHFIKENPKIRYCLDFEQNISTDFKSRAQQIQEELIKSMPKGLSFLRL